MNGVTVETVASSWIEALGGLSQIYMRSVPPGCWASAAVVVWSTMAARVRPLIDRGCSMRILASAPFLACAVSGERVRGRMPLFVLFCCSMDAAAGPWQARWNHFDPRLAAAARVAQCECRRAWGYFARSAERLVGECSANAPQFCRKKRVGERQQLGGGFLDGGGWRSRPCPASTYNAGGAGAVGMP